jgi:hypothetical protein
VNRPARGTATLLLVVLPALVLVAATCSHSTKQPMKPPFELPVVDTPIDLGQRAYAHVEKLVGFGPRHSGSPGWRQALDYIAATLQATTGIEPVRDRWTDERHGIAFENIHVTLPGRSPHRLLLGCHHDTKKCEGHQDPAHNYHFVGANDSGSGVGLLLALAEVLAKREREATLQLVFFDGEESLEYQWNVDKALFGSRRFMAMERELEVAPGLHGKVRALVLLDMVGARDLQIDEETHSDAQLRDIFASAAHAHGYQDLFFQKRMAITDDHIPFRDAGIPAIDLIDLVDNPQWHTADDTLEHISAASLQIVGEVVMTALPAIEQRYFAARGTLHLPPSRR